jgi:hypothetical protein
MELKTLSVLEHTHISEMQDDLRRKLYEAQKKDVGRGDGLRRPILSMVVGENYEGAKDRMQAYVEDLSQYPMFQERVDRYVRHCNELIQAIQTKRNFPGLAALSLSRQQEIHEKVLEHFEELKQNLKHIEQIERDHKLIDVRSTVWVLKTTSIVVGSIVAVMFLLDLQSGLLSSLVYTTNQWIDSASTWFVNLVL